MPSCFFDNLKYVIANGHELAKNFIFPEPHPNFQPAMTKEIEKARLFGCGLAVAQEVMFFGLLHGCSDAILQNRDRELDYDILDLGFQFAALSEKHLIKSFLWLPLTVRQELYRKAEAINEKTYPWRRRLAGGEAVAVVARVLTEMGYQVFFPTAKEDTENKIDLIAAHQAKSHFLCLQIKAKGSSYQTQEGSVGIQAASRRYVLQFYTGVSYFNLDHQGHFAPLMLNVGFKEVPLGKMQESTIIRPSIQNIIQKHWQQSKTEVA
ncbi:hypothetical protein KJ611_03545 [Patescibacteria group bacterium]|nr:hypothetical protein [Patescibacteria group bacterium]